MQSSRRPMKFRVPEVLMGCLLTVAVLSIGMTLSSSFQHEVVTAHAETVDERLARYTGWLAVLTAGLVVASLAQFYFLNRAEKTSQALARLAREEFVATHRPRVIVRFLQGPFHDDDGHVFIG
jgi:heme/copper-type cytochrome/quinol oxidase subunit 2